ncbi:TM0106 family RecB-like putative nuclease [Pseudidiomarina terrestris]|uniref:TM0106 family RecB-like putative nuclease n=1 Tax=Pseudidiomarina terrestris TaxID=2820060 RepID=UPI00264CBAB3|nr:TM0106 family RecB-like putative nuclease [Pseudidiomarina sp. 1ASP75-5]MDN7135347.1 TM0106 family RecB-like putative nuclease [Pseudidiomarina sp. 1ASP75-5]
MRQLNGKIYYSPSELTLFHDSPFASWCEFCYRATDQRYPTPDPEDAFLVMLQEAGYAHEKWLVNDLKHQGRNVIDVKERCADGTFLDEHQMTRQLMAEGTDVIFQAALMDDRFAGYADFLVKIDVPSELGDYSYVVWDTKLSKTAKVTHLLQLLAYARMVESVQGNLPVTVTVVLGSHEFDTYPTAEYLAYFESTRDKFLLAAESFNQEAMPDPYESKEFGRWSNFAEKLLSEQRHLSLVANVRRSQVLKLNNAGIHTIDALAELDDLSSVKIPKVTLEKLREQAQAQVATEQMGKPQYRLRALKPNEPKPFDHLMPFSRGDIYFDLEGNPLAEGGLEFLWGMTVFDDADKQSFVAYWAHNAEEEKKALGQFFEFTLDRWQRFPDMRVYHYAPYEMTALKRLVARYGIYEAELDDMLRAGLFVDLYKVVKSTLVIGLPSYSIKKVELFYRSKRETEIGVGGDAVVAYQNWVELGDDKILEAIEHYNKDDCDSTYELASWLRVLEAKHRPELAQLSKDKEYEREAGVREKKPDENAELKAQLQELADAQEDAEERHAIETLMNLIDFHQREEKPKWWQFFEWLGLPDDELIEERNVIVDCRIVGRAENLFRVNYLAEQEATVSAGAAFGIKSKANPEISSVINARIVSVLDGTTFEISVAKKDADRVPISFTLVAKEIVPSGVMAKSLVAFAAQVCSQRTLGESAVADVLRRSAPRFTEPLTTLQANQCEQEERLNEVIRLVENLNHSYLTVQGPPGTGKTFTASRVIGHLLRSKPNLAIGISSNSHKALNNLLRSVVEYCRSEGIACNAFTLKVDEELESLGVKTVGQNNKAWKVIGPDVVIGGTAWMFSRDDMQNSLDYLFVDEAGQVALANVVAMAPSARNIVFMGDQMQLGQPTQGTHPGEAGFSVLDYLMKHEQVVPEDKGVLLSRSYRMHEDILGFISRMVYQGRLEPDPANAVQSVELPEHGQCLIRKNTGIEFHQVDHDGNTVASDEEASYIYDLYQQLLGQNYTNKQRVQHAICADDILIVTPYNLQVQCLKNLLPKARIGTVDKFQGQEAPIVIFSFCSSAPDESPRGLDFLFDIRRLNVAVSRAQALAIVIGSPRLMDVGATSISLMKKASLVVELGCIGK